MNHIELLEQLGVQTVFTDGAWDFDCPIHPGKKATVTMSREGTCESGCTYGSFVSHIQGTVGVFREPPPLDIYPKAIADELKAMHLSTGAPLAYFALGALPVVAVAIGDAYRVHIKGGWDERACFWVALMGESGMGKDPAINTLTAPLRQKEAVLQRQNKKTFETWEQDDKKTRGSIPMVYQLLVQDFTIEALITSLNSNPRGLLAFDGELSGFVNSFGQYKGGKGNDRAYVLKMYSGTDVIVSRASKPLPMMVENPTLSILGGLQPGLFNALDGSDGLRARFLFADGARLVKDRFFDDEGYRPPSESYQEWFKLIDRLISKREIAIGHSVVAPTKGAKDLVDPLLTEITNGLGIGSGDVPEMYRKTIGVLWQLALCAYHMDRVVTGELDKEMDEELMMRVIPFWRWCQKTAIEVLDKDEPMSQRDIEKEKKYGKLRVWIERQKEKGIKLSVRLCRNSGPTWCRVASSQEIMEALDSLGYDGGFEQRLSG